MMDCKAEVLSVDVDIRAQECECDTQESQDDDEEEEETNNELVSFPYEKCGTFFQDAQSLQTHTYSRFSSSYGNRFEK